MLHPLRNPELFAWAVPGLCAYPLPGAWRVALPLAK